MQPDSAIELLHPVPNLERYTQLQEGGTLLLRRFGEAIVLVPLAMLVRLTQIPAVFSFVSPVLLSSYNWHST